MATFPVSKDHPICRKWSRILRVIVENMNRAGICIIACVQRGKKVENSTTTVLIVFDSKGRPKHENETRRHIRNLLDKNHLEEVMVEFVRGKFIRGGSSLSGQELDRQVLQRPCLIGQSLALENAYNSGTLGGLLELKMPGQQTYITVALTCFHVVNPSEKGLDPELLEQVRLWRKEGIKPTDIMRRRLRIEHPSPSAIKNKVVSLNEEIYAIEQDPTYAHYSQLESEGLLSEMSQRTQRNFLSMKKTLLDLRSFLHEIETCQTARRQYFGHVFAASGFRTGVSNGNRSNLDWALIEIPHGRVGENITPDGKYLKDSPIPTDLDGISLFIHGQRSGYCEGTKAPLETARLKHEIVDGVEARRETFEHLIFPRSGLHFSDGGDSGALVFTASHVVVGMLFAGMRSADGFLSQPSYFTRIEDIIMDIKLMTKATDVRLKMNRP